MTNFSFFEDPNAYRNYLSCSIVQSFNYPDRCHYVQTTPECQKKKFYINYIELFYCGFNPQSDFAMVFCTICLISLCGIAFLILGTTADRFFCPALKVICHELGMSEHMAGVTLLAFGNGSPDLFTTFASIHESSRFQFSDLVGACMYVNGFIAGLICLLCPFKMQANNTFRDVCFIFFGILYTNYAILSGGVVTVFESIVVLSIYITYIIVLIVDQFLLKRTVKYLETTVRTSRFVSEHNLDKLTRMRSEAGIDMAGGRARETFDIDFNRRATYDATHASNRGLFSDFIRAIDPFERENWKNGGFFVRFLVILRIIPNFVLNICIPITDYEAERHGWSKLLNSLQISILPAVIIAIVFEEAIVFGYPLMMYFLCLTVPITLILLITTRTDIPPRYHMLFSVYGCLGSMFVIYTCASETVHLFYVLGLVTNCSNSFLGCTLLAWGNSVGDLASNIALSLSGYNKMAYAACLGGPLFNSLIGMGGTFLYRTLQSDSGEVVIPYGPMGENCLVFFVLFQCSTMVWLISTNFYARRSIGVFNVIVYLLFLLYAILNETEITQSFASEEQVKTTGFI